MSRQRPLASGLLLVLAITVPALAGCQSGSPASGATRSTTPAPSSTTASPTPTPTSASAGPEATFPLTGEPAPGGGPAAQPVLAVAVPSGPGLPPPTGLQAADVVYVDYPGAGIARYVGLYQSQRPARIGPVGPAAPEDVRLLDTLHPLFAFADGPKRFVKPLTHSSIVGLPRSAHPTAYTGTAPALDALPKALIALAPPQSVPPPVLISHSQPLAGVGVHPARTLSITVPGRAQVTWHYDTASRAWRQAGAGGATATNLIVQTMPYRSVLDRNHGTPVRSPVIVGEGTCLGASLDRAAACRWTKPGRSKLTNYIDGAGVPLQFAPGRTWIALVPPGSAVKAG